jgi:hypothetical protein
MVFFYEEPSRNKRLIHIQAIADQKFHEGFVLGWFQIEKG